MPTKVRETSLYSPGKLVKSRKDIYSVGNESDPNNWSGRVPEGTVGLVLSGPNSAEGFHNHCQVQFNGNIVWWVNFGEIEPYLD